MQVAALVCAWQAARTRVEQQQEKMEGECDAHQVVKPLSVTDHQAMRLAFQRRYWKLEENQVPAISYLEAMQTEIGSGEIRAEALASIYSAEEDEDPDDGDRLLQEAIDMAIRNGKGWAPGEKEAYMKKIERALKPRYSIYYFC